jgi:hypothetical protein
MEKSIIDWVKYLTKKRDELGGFSICPFAKKALDDNKIKWTYIAFEPIDYISRYIESLDEEYEVLLFINATKNLSDNDCIDIIKFLNDTFPDVVFLKDHPDTPGYINGVSTGNGEYPIILAQPRKALSDARNILTRTKYYDNWNEDYKKEIWSY